VTEFNQRRLIDAAISLPVYILCFEMMHLWSLVVLAFGLWNYYDGATRMDLEN